MRHVNARVHPSSPKTFWTPDTRKTPICTPQTQCATIRCKCPTYRPNRQFTITLPTPSQYHPKTSRRPVILWASNQQYPDGRTQQSLVRAKSVHRQNTASHPSADGLLRHKPRRRCLIPRLRHATKNPQQRRISQCSRSLQPSRWPFIPLEQRQQT